MSATLLDIGDVIERSGLPASTLHLWERKGLIDTAGRVGLRRQYQPQVLDTIAIIVLCQRSGFSLAEIDTLLSATNSKALLQSKLAELEAKRQLLDQAIEGLQHAVACTEPSPTTCDGFRRSLVGVLPVSDA